MSELKSEFITRKKPVYGFTGVGTLYERDGHQIAFICADEDILLEQLKELMPEADLTETQFQRLTIIQANDNPTTDQGPQS